MARLRKLSITEPSIFLPSVPTTAPRPSRSSPRKGQSLRESPSKRELRYTSSQDTEDSFLIPKAPAGDSPVRKQRILRPVASNSRLLRKLSNESLASPEKKERRSVRDRVERDSGRNYLYSQSLAKSVARKQAINGGSQRTIEERELRIERETVLDEDENLIQEEADQSLWCGDEDEKENMNAVPGEDEDDEDDDPVVNVRNRRRQPRARRMVSDTEEEDEDDDLFAPLNINSALPLTKEVEVNLKAEMPPPLTTMKLLHRKGHSAISNWAREVIDLTSSPDPSSYDFPPPVRARSGSLAAATRTSSRPASSRPPSSASNDIDAMLHFSPTPTKQRSPRKAPPISRPSTPPLLPTSPSKLISPSKKKPSIPKAPDLCPSLDAFWCADVVNDWNDKHSPSKPLVSPRKQKWRQNIEAQMNAITISDSESDDPVPSPSASPRKKKAPSQTKEDTSGTSTPTVSEVRAQRKDFAAKKHSIAEAFLTELDNTITNGRITELSQQTGGIKLVWSKTLKTTAGRANWRREQIRLRTGPLPTDTQTEIRHQCSIELAEKVIDDEERLYNVLAHEYCHLTTFMISEVRNNPHGAEFKTWGRKVTNAFSHKGVEVTTKHSYKIDYKYIWECIACGYEFKRHSKSVDPLRHSCGRCKGKLVQTKPTPRGGSSGKNGETKREKSEYQVFVKANFARVKKELEARGADAQMGKVMEAVAKEYRENKERKSKSEMAKQVDEVELALEGLQL